MNFIKEILQIIDKAFINQSVDLNNELRHFHEKDIADAYLELSNEKQIFFRQKLDSQFLSDIFAYFSNENIDKIKELPNEKIADIIELMDSDDAMDVLDELDVENREEVLGLIEGDIKDDIKLIDSFSDEEIGSLMTNNYISISINNNIKDAMSKVVQMAGEKDNISTIIVTNNEDKYIGTLELTDLIRTKNNVYLEDIVKLNTPFIMGDELIDSCIDKIRDYSLDIIPVLNDEKHVIGALTKDDVIELVDSQISEDYAKLAGLSSEDDLDESLFSSVKKRLPWLAILLVLSIFVSMLISRFEVVVSVMTTIMFFQSLVLDSAGNVGTQSLAVSVRVLSDEPDLSKKNKLKLLFKEVRIGFFNGLILGAASFIVIFSFLFLTKQEIINGTGFVLLNVIKTSLTVSVALVAAMTISSFFGTLIPIILERFHIDPATASGPFITTINDCVGVICYYGMAILMFYTFIF